jgi:DNA-directed RNA polymerase specialized sigma24 family protein
MSAKLTKQFAFGYYTPDDIRQECFILALNLLRSGKWDATRPFEPFLHKHLYNRLINFRRDNYIRNDPPCLICHRESMLNKLDTPYQCVHALPGESFCQRYTEWALRNANRRKLTHFSDISINDDSLASAAHADEHLGEAELRSKIDRVLPVGLRLWYLKMLAGETIPPMYKQRVQEFISEALAEHE